MKKIIIYVVMLLLFSGCSHEYDYKEVSKDFLKKELSINGKNYCVWHYGRKDAYHLFSLLCSENNDSFLISKKNYKIKISKLKVITSEPVLEKPWRIIDKGSVDIEW